MEISFEDIFVPVAFVFAIICIVGGSYEVGHQSGVKQGQVDCINGNIYYQLKEQSNKSTEWVLTEHNSKQERGK